MVSNPETSALKSSGVSDEILLQELKVPRSFGSYEAMRNAVEKARDIYNSPADLTAEGGELRRSLYHQAICAILKDVVSNTTEYECPLLNVLHTGKKAVDFLDFVCAELVATAGGGVLAEDEKIDMPPALRRKYLHQEEAAAAVKDFVEGVIVRHVLHPYGPHERHVSPYEPKVAVRLIANLSPGLVDHEWKQRTIRDLAVGLCTSGFALPGVIDGIADFVAELVRLAGDDKQDDSEDDGAEDDGDGGAPEESRPRRTSSNITLVDADLVAPALVALAPLVTEEINDLKTSRQLSSDEVRWVLDLWADLRLEDDVYAGIQIIRAEERRTSCALNPDRGFDEIDPKTFDSDDEKYDQVYEDDFGGGYGGKYDQVYEDDFDDFGGGYGGYDDYH